MSEAIGGNSQAQLKSIVGRVEHLNEEIKGLGEDRKEIFQEASSAGFDVKALRAIIRRRAADAAKLAEQEAIVETYMHALGMI